MSKGTTRRSISLKGLTYQRLKNYCDAKGKSVSGYLEEIVKEKLDVAGEPAVTVLTHEPKPLTCKDEEAIGAHFTF